MQLNDNQVKQMQEATAKARASLHERYITSAKMDASLGDDPSDWLRLANALDELVEEFAAEIGIWVKQ